MPDTLEPPPAPRKGGRVFTKENAAEMARRSHAPTSARYRAPIPDPLPIADPEQQARLSLVLRQIALAQAALEDRNLAAKDRAQLLRSLCMLLDRERILRGEPLPGSRRPAPERHAPQAPPARSMPKLALPAPDAGNDQPPCKPSSDSSQAQSSS